MNYATALLDTREMGEADRLTVVAGTSVSQLMENAGRGVAQEVMRRWSVRRVTVLCGPGNNGGDGFVAARLLAEAGWNVTVALLGTLESLKGAARQHADKWPGGIEAVGSDAIDSAELIVDALFGAGLNRPLSGPAKETLAAASALRAPLVAVDIPSGVQGDTGENLGAVKAHAHRPPASARSPDISCTPAARSAVNSSSPTSAHRSPYSMSSRRPRSRTIPRSGLPNCRGPTWRATSIPAVTP